MRRQHTSPKKVDQSKAKLLSSVLSSLFIKRKLFSMQLLKRFILFPDESDSSEHTCSKYDKLIFNDESLHTMFKKLQTKFIENKIWAFINLKTHKYIEQVKTFQRKIKRLKKKVEDRQIVNTFHQIKTFSFFKLTQHQPQHNITTTTSIKRIQITDVTVNGTTGVRQERKGRVMTTINTSQNQTRNRSRSGSITRYEYDTVNCKRILLNGEIIPCKIEVRKSVSPMKEPQYIKITKTPQKCSQDIQYIGLSRRQLQKRQNLKYEYQDQPSRKVTANRDNSRSRIICIQRLNANDIQNISRCSHCEHTRNSSCTCIEAPKNQKIIRLKSTKKIQQSSNYLEHLNT